MGIKGARGGKLDFRSSVSDVDPNTDPSIKVHNTPMANLRQIQFIDVRNEREPFVSIDLASRRGEPTAHDSLNLTRKSV